MPEQPAAEKTEQPTPKRLEKARGQGQVPQSQELASVAVIIGLAGSLAVLAPVIRDWFVVQLQQGLSGARGVFSDCQAFTGFLRAKIADSVMVIWPVLACVVAASVLSGIAVSGVNFAPAALRFRWEMVNPAAGLKRLFNAHSLVRLLTSIAKLLVVGMVVWLYIRGRLDDFGTLRWAWSGQMLTAISRLIFGLLVRICIVLLVIGLADAFYQRWKYIHDLKMTRQEVKQERKDYEGSPELRGRIRRAQLEMAMRRVSVEVPKATVVLTNPTHVAVALRYEADAMDAPVLVAKGADHLAEKIRAVARAYGVPVIRRPELARSIYSTVKTGNAIPESLYVAVAEVLALIYRLRRKRS